MKPETICKLCIITGIALMLTVIILQKRKEKPVEIDWPNVHHVSITVTNLGTDVIRFNIDLQY